MKYLKTYKIFESVSQEHIKILKDMALSLLDKDFTFNAYEQRSGKEINISIGKVGFNFEYYFKEFRYSEIKDELLEMIDYMDVEGWKVLDIEINKKKGERFGLSVDDHHTFDKIIKTLDEFNEPIEMIKVSFVEK